MSDSSNENSIGGQYQTKDLPSKTQNYVIPAIIVTEPEGIVRRLSIGRQTLHTLDSIDSLCRSEVQKNKRDGGGSGAQIKRKIKILKCFRCFCQSSEQK